MRATEERDRYSGAADVLEALRAELAPEDWFRVASPEASLHGPPPILPRPPEPPPERPGLSTRLRQAVVVVPFPFPEGPGTKRRPGLVLSGKKFNSRGHSVLAMITTKAKPSWPGDHPLGDLAAAGLDVHCLVRLKIFTLDNRLVAHRIGRLDHVDRDAVVRQLTSPASS